MSFTRRALMLSLGMLQCFAGSGIIYGWTSLEQLFVNTGVYASACPPGNHTCPAQTLRFSLIFTITSNVNMLAGIVMGYILDRWGPRASVVQSLLAVLLGLLLVAFSSPTFDGYLAGMICVGFGGPGIQNGLMHLSNLFPDNKVGTEGRVCVCVAQPVARCGRVGGRATCYRLLCVGEGTARSTRSADHTLLLLPPPPSRFAPPPHSRW